MIDIPAEGFAIMESKDKDGYAKDGYAKDGYARIAVFGFNCSAVLEYEEIDENLCPSQEEFRQMHDITEELVS